MVQGLQHLPGYPPFASSRIMGGVLEWRHILSYGFWSRIPPPCCPASQVSSRWQNSPYFRMILIQRWRPPCASPGFPDLVFFRKAFFTASCLPGPLTTIAIFLHSSSWLPSIIIYLPDSGFHPGNTLSAQRNLYYVLSLSTRLGIHIYLCMAGDALPIIQQFCHILS